MAFPGVVSFNFPSCKGRVLTGEDEGECDAGPCHALDDVVVRHIEVP
jgi:hypothetical protein